MANGTRQQQGGSPAQNMVSLLFQIENMNQQRQDMMLRRQLGQTQLIKSFVDTLAGAPDRESAHRLVETFGSISDFVPQETFREIADITVSDVNTQRAGEFAEGRREASQVPGLMAGLRRGLTTQLMTGMSQGDREEDLFKTALFSGAEPTEGMREAAQVLSASGQDRFSFGISQAGAGLPEETLRDFAGMQAGGVMTAAERANNEVAWANARTARDNLAFDMALAEREFAETGMIDEDRIINLQNQKLEAQRLLAEQGASLSDQQAGQIRAMIWTLDQLLNAAGVPTERIVMNDDGTTRVERNSTVNTGPSFNLDSPIRDEVWRPGWVAQQYHNLTQ